MHIFKSCFSDIELENITYTPFEGPEIWLLEMKMGISFTSKGVLTDPDIVQASRVTLEFWATPEQTVPAGGYVRLTAPDSVKVHTTGIQCYDVVNLVECEVQARSGVITITNSVELRAGAQFQYSLIDAVDNPVSS